MVTTEHPNVALLKRLDFGNLDGSAELFVGNFVWHFFNPRLPDLQGDYVGLSGLQTFLEKLGALTGGTFTVDPISIAAFGDELVVMHNKNRMTLQGMAIETDVVVVWRIVDGRFPKCGTSRRFMRCVRRGSSDWANQNLAVGHDKCSLGWLTSVGPALGETRRRWWKSCAS